MPILSIPDSCLELRFNKNPEWRDLREAERKTFDAFISTKGETILAWGTRDTIEQAFGANLISIQTASLSSQLASLKDHLNIKAFLEHAIGLGLRRDRPLLLRRWGNDYVLVADKHAKDQSYLHPLQSVLDFIHGDVEGVFTAPTDDSPEREQVAWAEAAVIGIDERDGRFWLTVRPVVWIWPKRARKIATEFLDRRIGDRYNKMADKLLSAWLQVLLPTEASAVDVTVSFLKSGSSDENPTFILNSRTAFSRRL